MPSAPNLADALNILAIMVFAGLLTRAALEDLFERRIPNAVCIGITVSFGIHGAAAPQQTDWLDGLSVAAIVFVFGALLFARGAMGGGDVKLMTACGLWCGFDMAWAFALIVSLAGGVLALTYPLANILFPAREAAENSPAVRLLAVARPSGDETPATSRDELPYGVAIAAGGLWLAAETFLRQIAAMGGAL